MQVFLGVVFDDAYLKDKTTIRIYMKSKIKFKKTVYDYELLTLLAEMGGYSGILFGISIVNLTSLVSRVGDRLNL